MAVTRVFLSERELLDAIKREELDNTVRFVKQRRRVSASEEGLTLEGKRVRFQDEGLPSTAVNIPYDGTPFIVLNSEVYECQHGPQHSKEVKDVVGKTKKLNCQAVIRIRRVLKFPEFKINGNPTKSAKILMSCRLKSTFNADTNKQLMIYANISSKDDHQNHPIGEVAGFTQAVDSGIIAKIKQLARDGHRKVSSVKLLLRDFVREELAPEAIETNRRFFPTSSDIRNHIYQAVVGGSFQSLEDDQMNVAKLVEEMKNLHPHDKYFFRPASSNEDCVESLLLVMQTNFQQKMLLRYGSEIVLMDATYKTTRYELPMYNLCVPSNSGYIVVGSFYISKDTMSSVREALEVLRKWNAGWTPRYFMCDFDLREVGAVESTFKGAEVLLCNFHRDQAWQRWLTANKITEKETVMQQLRAIALTSETEEYEASVEIVRSSQLYKENAAFKNWFEKKWIANSKRWVYLFRKDLSLIVTTTNGIESQYKTLKHCYLKEFGTGKSLQNVVEIFLKKYFPDSERSYKRANAMAREDVRRHASSDFPQFLIGRPKPFIKHCMGRIPPKVPEINEVVDTGNDTFVVSSNEVTVSNSIPKCTCVDYRKMKWPCKHILAIHMKKGVSYTDYFSHPLFTLDESAFDVACPVNTDDTEISPAMVQEPSVVKTENSCRRDCLEQLKLIENGLYIISDVQLLESVNRQLEGVTKFVEANTVKVCGLTKGKKRKWRRTSIRRHAKKPKNQKKTKEATVSGNTMQPTSSVVVHETSTTEEELMRIWSNPPNDETVLQLGPYNITNRSLHFLKTTLSDEIMDAYLKLLTTGTNVLHISSVIATAIFEGRDNLSHFLTREQFDHYDYCIAAVNERGHHWVLIIIQPQERKLIYINPMGEIRAVCNNLLQFWCNFIAGQNRPLQEQRMAWSIETVDHSKQFDSVSCGVYVLRFAENFLSNATLKFNWTFGDIVQERKRMAIRLMNCGYEAPIAVETMAAPGPRQQTDKETDIEAPIAVETMAAPGPRQQTDKETDIEAPIAVEKMASPAPRQQTDKETDIEAPIAVETMAAPGPRQQTDKETDIDSLTGSVLHRNQRKRYRKEKRHSFLYPKLKRKQNLFCVCHQRNDGRTYWQCDVCEDWFHPECIGFKEEDEPSQFICDDCKPSEKEKAKTACMDVGPGQDKISKKQKRHIARRHLLMSSLTKDTDNAEMQQWEKNMCVPAFALETTPPIVMQEDEDVYETCSTTQQPDVFRVEDIENALREGYSLVSGVASGRVKSQFHEDFMEIRNRKCTRGYGLLMFTSETYMAVEVWVRQTFLKDITKDMFAKWGTVRGAGEDLLTTLKESPSNAEIYIMNVIFKEVITRIYMILKKMSWKHAVSLCRSTEAESWLKAMKLVTSKNKRT